VQGDVAAQFGAEVHLAEHGVGAQLHSELVAQIHGLRGCLGPALQFQTACGEHAVFLLAGIAGIGRNAGLDPASRLHAREFAVDLLVGGVPEVADGLVKPARQRTRTCWNPWTWGSSRCPTAC
jgi:hypothetical protein